MCQYIERSGFPHPRYDEANVVDNEIIVHMKYTSVSYIVVTPLGKKFGGKLVIITACHFDNEG